MNWLLQQHLVTLSKVLLGSKNVYHKDNNIEFLYNEIKALRNIILCIFKQNKQYKELCSISFRPSFGHLVYLMLNVFENSSYDVKLRLNAAEILYLLLTISNFQNEKISTSDSFALILPGFFSRCKKICLNNINTSISYKITEKAIELISNIIILTFTNEFSSNKNIILDQNNLYDSFKRTLEWRFEVYEKLHKQLNLLSSQLCKNNNFRIRYAICKLMFSTFKCFYDISNSSLQPLVDVCIILKTDQNLLVKDYVNEILLFIESKQNSNFLNYLGCKITNNVKNLYQKINQCNDGFDILQNLINCIECWNIKTMNNFMLTNPNFIKELIYEVIRIIKFNDKCFFISKNYFLKLQNSISNNLLISPKKNNFLEFKEFFDVFSLCKNINFLQLFRLAELLSFYKNIDTVLEDILVNDLFKSNKQVSYIIFISFIISFVSNNNKKSTLIKNYIKTIILIIEQNEFNNLLFENNLLKDNVSNDKTLFICFALFSISFGLITIENDDNELMINVIYEFLKWSTSSQLILNLSAQFSLEILAKANTDSSATFLLLSKANFILFKILLKFKDVIYQPDSFCVLAKLIDQIHFKSLAEYKIHNNLFEELRNLMEDLIYMLDNKNEKINLYVLYAIKSFVKAINIFNEISKGSFKEINLLDYDVATKKKNNIIIVKILQRIKNILLSSYIPFELCILDVLDNGLYIISDSESELLPIIHQSWHGIMEKINYFINNVMVDSYSDVAIKSIKVIETMCKLSGTFLYHKVTDELLPCITKYLLNFKLQTQNNSYFLSNTYRFQITIIEMIPLLIDKCKLSLENKELLIIINKYTSEYLTSEIFQDINYENIRIAINKTKKTILHE